MAWVFDPSGGRSQGDAQRGARAGQVGVAAAPIVARLGRILSFRLGSVLIGCVSTNRVIRFTR
jgi:hypothetical protein